MQASTTSTIEHQRDPSRKHCRDKGEKWSGVNIAIMVVGFILFWPIGLFILFWILSGRNIKTLPGKARNLWFSIIKWGSSYSVDHTDNVIMNEYQQAQHDRIKEIKEECR